MNNVFQTPLRIHEVYDLKGSSVKRLVSPEEIAAGTKVLKDVNFDVQRGVIAVGSGASQQLLTQLIKDVDWLRDNNVMDYSLLLGIHGA